MNRYQNLGDNSGIRSYDITYDSITILFSDGGLYVYDYETTGVDRVEEMKRLARNGKGLNSFISRVIKKSYADKLT